MEKKIQHYLHLYGIDCPIMTPDGKGDVLVIYPKAVEVSINTIAFKQVMKGRKGGGEMHYIYKYEECKPILSRLEDITDDDIKGLIGYEKLIEMYSGVEYRKERNRVDVNYDVDMEDFGKQPFYHSVKFYQLEPRQFHYLLSKGYWLFGNDWFDEGIIIDRKTLES